MAVGRTLGFTQASAAPEPFPIPSDHRHLTRAGFARNGSPFTLESSAGATVKGLRPGFSSTRD